MKKLPRFIASTQAQPRPPSHKPDRYRHLLPGRFIGLRHAAALNVGPDLPRRSRPLGSCPECGASLAWVGDWRAPLAIQCPYCEIDPSDDRVRK